MINVTVQKTSINVQTQPIVVRVEEPTLIHVVTVGIQGPPGPPGSGSGALTWQVVTNGQILEPNNGYQYDGLSLGIFTLPPSPTNGDRVALHRIGSANWQLQENDGQFIFVINVESTVSTGYVQSLEPGGALELSYTGNGRWEATGILGNIEVI